MVVLSTWMEIVMYLVIARPCTQPLCLANVSRRFSERGRSRSTSSRRGDRSGGAPVFDPTAYQRERERRLSRCMFSCVLCVCVCVCVFLFFCFCFLLVALLTSLPSRVAW